MLKIQKLFEQQSLEKIIEDYKLKATFHLNDERVILNYGLESPKFDPIIDECRGLVLNKNTGELVARAFKRFYNVGETDKDYDKFNWKNFICQEKLDGSLILLYHWNGDWRINTRGSFGDGLVNNSDKTWHDLFYSVIPKSDLKYFDERYTYIFELIGPYNKVVHQYPKTNLVLLSVFHKEQELPYYDYLYLGNTIYLSIPKDFNFSSLEEIKEFITQLEEESPTQEGVVIRDNFNRRWKIKNRRWFDLSKIRGETGNLFHPKYLLPFILKQDTDELLTYFPEVKETYFKYYDRVWKELYPSLMILLLQYENLKSQKDFALKVKDNPLSSILFNVRKNNTTLLQEFIQSENLILKNLK